MAVDPVDGVIRLVIKILHRLEAGPMVFGHEMGDFVVDIIDVAVFPVCFKKVMLAPCGHKYLTSRTASAKPMATARAAPASGRGRARGV